MIMVRTLIVSKTRFVSRLRVLVEICMDQIDLVWVKIIAILGYVIGWRYGKAKRAATLARLAAKNLANDVKKQVDDKDRLEASREQPEANEGMSEANGEQSEANEGTPDSRQR